MGSRKPRAIGLASDDFFRDGIGRQLEPFVRGAEPYHSRYLMMLFFGIRFLSWMKSSCATIHQPSENGRGGAPVHAPEARPVQRHARRRNDMPWGSNSGKNAPSMIFQSPSSQARTSAGEPEALSRLM